MQQTSIAMDIAQMRPGDSIDVFFPQGFKVVYTKTEFRADGSLGKVVRSEELVRMNAYYWDDDDHRTKDYYFYDAQGQRFAKMFDLTSDSREKVWNFIRTA